MAINPVGGTNLRLTISSNFEAVKKQLAKVGKALDEKEILNAIGLRVISWSSTNIKRGGFPAVWPNMSENTLTVKPQRSGPHNFSSRYQSQLLQKLAHKVSGHSVTIGVQDQYASYHHFGTKPYIIRPRNAPFLAFQVASGLVGTKLGSSKPVAGSTTTVFANEVHHPGLKPRPLLPSKAVLEQLAVGVLKAAVARAVKS